MLFCAVAVGGNGISEVMESFTLKASAYSTGDYIYFGTYPQTDVTSSLGYVLNNQPGSWVSYGYYIGTGSEDDGQMKPSDYMRYKDVTYNGDKYRGVIFDSYRPDCTGFTYQNTYQDNNGYYTNTVYWFKYEPIKWKVLDPSIGLIMTDIAIDSQAYNNYVYFDGKNYYGEPNNSYYATNYAKCSIRFWLNNDFYDVAFSDKQKNNIVLTTLDNSSVDSSEYDAPSTRDKIFLLSYSDLKNSKYGFVSNADRQLKSTDYAKSQGCYQNTYDSYYGNCWWWLRSSNSSHCVRDVGYNGDSDYIKNAGSTEVGVVPALRLQNLESSTTGNNIVDDPVNPPLSFFQKIVLFFTRIFEMILTVILNK